MVVVFISQVAATLIHFELPPFQQADGIVAVWRKMFSPPPPPGDRMGLGADGMPVGVQLLAPALGEPVMFQAAAVLEEAMK